MSEHKICARCGAENPQEARFCQECGSALAKRKNRKCPVCNTTNEATAKFCKNCGASLTSGKRKKNSAAARQSSKTPLYIGAGIIGALLLFLFMQDVKGPGEHNHDPVQVEQVSNDVALEAAVIDIAQQFYCACGSCQEDSLEDCACPTAQQERNFIRQALRSGQTREAIIKAVKAKYGYAKPETEKTG